MESITLSKSKYDNVKINLKIGGFMGGFMNTVLLTLHKEKSQFWSKYVRRNQQKYNKNEEANSNF